MLPILLNQLQVVSAIVNMPANGVWTADLDVDLDVSMIVPSGKCVLTIGTTPMIGTIDPRSTGRFGAKAHVQVSGGGGGWDKPVLGLHLHNDVGVLSSAILAVTAAEVGEAVVDTIPKRLGVDYVRTAGPASRVLSGFDWHVDTSGVTVTGPRLPIPFNPLTVDILSWDAETRCATLASDELVLPGTVLVDIRFGTAIVRDVEQTFSAEGSKVSAWCDTSTLSLPVPGVQKETPGNRIARAIGMMAREAAGVQYLKRWHYRVVLQNPANKRVTLQLVDILGGAPLALAEIDIWPGVCGSSHVLVPGTEVLVAFIEGDPAQPIVVGFAKLAPPPLETKLEAVRIALGSVAVDPVAKAPGTQAQIAALTTAVGALAAYVAALTALAATPPTSTTFTLFGAAMAAPGAAVATALGGLAAAVAAQVPLATSTKTFTD
jgi:hypothetical protein